VIDRIINWYRDRQMKQEIESVKAKCLLFFLMREMNFEECVVLHKTEKILIEEIKKKYGHT